MIKFKKLFGGRDVAIGSLFNKNKNNGALKSSRAAIIVACAAIVVGPVVAGGITYLDDSFQPGEILTAGALNAKFNEIKAAVNDNDSRVAALEGKTPTATDLNSLFAGQWTFQGSEQCFEAQGGINPDLSINPGGQVNTTSNIRGTRTSNGTSPETITSNIGYVSTPVDTNPAGDADPVTAGTNTSTCTETWAINPDLTFTSSQTCDIAFTGGPLSGLTGTVTGIELEGIINPSGTMAMSRPVPGSIQHVSIPGVSYEADRLCSGSFIGMKRSS